MVAAAPALWARSEAFCFGTLTGTPHTRLSVSNIRKIIAYSRSKGKVGFPRLHYHIWRHIACNKLQMPEEHAWMYFESFILISGELSPQKRKKVLGNLADGSLRLGADNCENGVGSGDGPSPVDWLAEVQGDTLKFVLFLYTQQLNKISFRSSIIAGDEWPMHLRNNPDLDSSRGSTGSGAGGSSASSNKHTDENAQYVFLMQHLSEILELLAEAPPTLTSDPGGGSPRGAGGSELVLTEGAVAALGYLIDGYLEKGRRLSPLLDIATHSDVAAKSGYSPSTGTFAFKPFHGWVRSTIGSSPFGVSACIAHGKRLSWLPPDLTGTVRRGKVGTNTHLVHRADVAGNKLVIMTQVSTQMVARSSGTLEDATIKLHRCWGSYFYLLSTLRAVSIEKCRNCLIVLGPVALTVYVTQCENVRIISPCAQLVIANSHDCSFHPLTLTRPLLLGGNERLMFGPYNTWYPQEGAHLRKAGLLSLPTAAANLWRRPLQLVQGETNLSSSIEGSINSGSKTVWSAIRPHEFHVVIVPFEMDGPTKGIPCVVPEEYRKALADREREAEKWQESVRESESDGKEKETFQGLVEQRFQDWLIETGAKKELDALVLHLDSASAGKR